MRIEMKELLYLHLHPSDRFVMCCGLTFEEFHASLDKPLQNLLLLKHSYKNAEYNMHTLLEFVYQEDVPKLLKNYSNANGEFCWTDFEDESGLGAIDGQELAELLYLGHTKHHLKPPFYRMLNNEFVYLSQDNGWFNKIYYRNVDPIFSMLGKVISDRMASLKVEKTWLGIRKKSDYTPVPVEIFIRLSALMGEGVVISFENITQSRTRLEVPIWVVGDLTDMDEVAESYQEVNTAQPEAKLIYTRKTREWTLVLQ
ncbi:hypothetical protein IEO70_15155 [Bacillus sp. AGMB 02131]|uniref:Oxalate:formate antiporter n=1 Tax=Peribacillus faecalis TaxID=2772559 RepID=A0A927CYZ7_9BACI|nr:hypothetical protein [Peribacillus faecalis]MBD3109684.1 hypothetical protein [Peribacillus faecalis]